MNIKRTLHGQAHTITLTEKELDQAYQIMEKRYLEEDFVNTMADMLQKTELWFHPGHLSEFPELLNWLCTCFDDFFDANMSRNDLLTLALNHLNHVSLEPQFFLELARAVPVTCMGMEKNTADCEQNCSCYHYCSKAADADDRSGRWGALASMLSIHKNKGCTCSKGEKARECPASKYLKGTWDISEFFHLETRKEAA